MKMTLLLLAGALMAAPAHAAVDACRSGRALEKPVRLSILPTNGSAPIELLLRYTGCFTTRIEPLFGVDVPPTAVRRYRADGIAWAVEFNTEDGSDVTELYVYYVVPSDNDPYPVAYLTQAKTAAIAGGRVDWGTQRFMNVVAPKFDFSARVVTQ